MKKNRSKKPVSLAPEFCTFAYVFRCQCERCSDHHLVGALESRCCRERVNASAKMTFDGSIERINCITQHEDYSHLGTHKQDGSTPGRPTVEGQRWTFLPPSIWLPENE